MARARAAANCATRAFPEVEVTDVRTATIASVLGGSLSSSLLPCPAADELGLAGIAASAPLLTVDGLNATAGDAGGKGSPPLSGGGAFPGLLGCWDVAAGASPLPGATLAPSMLTRIWVERLISGGLVLGT
eukprot:CAMPEP_0115174504 /NCGR_PEP_ID=MMETSP0270-20121206/3872_1 /TAXON_ID=71861 /ORGANISM="Scrippsiella trochoidea, Strain CCMP3099" /LENGTH=130 /DNA_ID=CAMNT_0002587343 /DNA_START=1105 /DNA_END=1494 /DNA_ORIENTATION=-